MSYAGLGHKSDNTHEIVLWLTLFNVALYE